MLTNEELEVKLAESPAPRVTKEYMESRIARKVTSKLPFTETVTICHLELDNGFSVRGESACVNLANYNQEIGEKIAYDNAFQKLWAFFGFVLAETGALPAPRPRVAEEGEAIEGQTIAERVGEYDSVASPQAANIA